MIAHESVGCPPPLLAPVNVDDGMCMNEASVELECIYDTLHNVEMTHTIVEREHLHDMLGTDSIAVAKIGPAGPTDDYLHELTSEETDTTLVRDDLKDSGNACVIMNALSVAGIAAPAPRAREGPRLGKGGRLPYTAADWCHP